MIYPTQKYEIIGEKKKSYIFLFCWIKTSIGIKIVASFISIFFLGNTIWITKVSSLWYQGFIAALILQNLPNHGFFSGRWKGHLVLLSYGANCLFLLFWASTLKMQCDHLLNLPRTMTPNFDFHLINGINECFIFLCANGATMKSLLFCYLLLQFFAKKRPFSFLEN